MLPIATFLTSLSTEVTGVAGDMATAAGYGLAIFVLIFGTRKVLQALKIVK